MTTPTARNPPEVTASTLQIGKKKHCHLVEHRQVVHLRREHGEDHRGKAHEDVRTQVGRTVAPVPLEADRRATRDRR